MKRAALIFTSGTLAFGVTLTGFYLAALLLNAAVQLHHGWRFVSWLK
jgi:hypothetical protein